jgi:hypothetical protein
MNDRPTTAPARRSRFSKGRKALVLAGALGLVAAACSDPPPPYPYYGQYGSDQGVVNEAQVRSDRLQQYIGDWMDGKVPATLPASLMPEGREAGLTSYTLKPVDQIDPYEQWVRRPAHTINTASSYGNFNDANAGYFVTYGMYAPFGSKMIMEGSFPKARYFDVQATPSFQTANYRHGAEGEGEVAWLDSDIEPLPGHTNPYRVGADRNAGNRSFRLECNMAVGDPTQLDPGAWSATHRQAGNTRHCSGITYRGPWGDPAYTGGGSDGRGLFASGEMWVRVYAPDKGTDGWGNMPPPTVYYQLPDGRQFGLEVAQSAIENRLNGKRALTNDAPADPNPAISAPGSGWDKQWSIFRSIRGGLSQGCGINGATDAERRAYVRQLDLGVSGRGENASGIMNLEPHSTGSVHINYLTRNHCLGSGKVYAISGKLPTTPKTRNGEPTMTGGQARYWSITGYSSAFSFDPGFQYGAEQTSIMDDEVVTDAEGDYVIMYGRPQDRPANATAANGVTWKDWGPEACQAFTLRWMSIGPEWTMPNEPTAANAGWETSWASASYDPSRLNANNRNGLLGTYHPVITYVTRAQFEALGNGFDAQTLPRF